MTDYMSQISTTVWTGLRGPRRVGRAAGATVSALALALVLASCGSASEGPASVPTRVPATPVAAPPTATPAAGTVAQMPVNITGVSVEPTSGTIVVQSTGPAKLVTYTPNDLATPKLEIDLPEGSRPAALTADGDVLVPNPGGLTVISLADGSTRTGQFDEAALSATQTADGRFAVGTDKGSVVILDAELNPERTVAGFVSVDGLVEANGFLMALDTHQTSVTEVDPDNGELSGALRVGMGATAIIADHYGRVIAADTDGGQIVVLGVDPLLNRQTGPVGASPYGLADDSGRNLVWVTLTATNEVAGYDLSSGAPEEKFRFPTVQDPRSVSVDGQTGDLYIGSGSGDGLQRIDAGAVK